MVVLQKFIEREGSTLEGGSTRECRRNLVKCMDSGAERKKDKKKAQQTVKGCENFKVRARCQVGVLHAGIPATKLVLRQAHPLRSPAKASPPNSTIHQRLCTAHTP